MRFPALWIVFVLALGVRLGHVLEIRDTVIFASPLVDAHTYDRSARAMASGGLGELEVPYYQPPFYPMLLAGIYAATGGSYVAPRIVHAVLGAWTVAAVFLLGSRLAGVRAGAVGAAFLGLYGIVLYFEGELLPTTLVLTLNTSALLLLSGADRHPAARRPLLAAGLLLGVSTIARPTTLLFALGAAGWWLGGRPRKARGPTLALFGAAVLLPILPITAENYRRAGERLLVSYNGGINFYLGNGAGSDSLTAIQPGYAWDRLQLEPHRAGVRTRAEESDYWVRRGLAEAAAGPGAWAAAFARKIVRLLDARETPRNLDYEVWRRESALLSLPLFGFGLVAPLALLGFGLPGLDRRTRGLLAIALATVAVQNLLFFVTGRYRAEAVPALCLLAGLGVERLLRSGVRGTGARPLLAAAALAAFVWIDFLGERGIDEARAALNRGVTLRRAGLSASATREFRTAVRFDPHHPDAHRLLGEMAAEDEDWPRALAHFETAIEGAPDYLMALLGRARVLESTGRRDEAETVYREVLVMDPWSYEVCLTYGVFLAVDGRLEEAREMFERGRRIVPWDDRFRANLENVRRLEVGQRPPP